MHPCRTSIAGAAALLVVSGAALHAQSSGQLGNAPLTHIGIVVADAAAAAKGLAAVMGVAPPAIQSITLDLPDQSKADIRAAVFEMPNFRIEIDQPMSPRGPVHDHLERFGPGIARLGFAVPEGLDEKRAHLVQQGGRWVAGVAGGPYAFVELRDKLGATIELVKTSPPAPGTPPPAPGGTTPAVLGRLNVSHVGIAVRNTDEVAKAFSDIFGIPMPQVRDYKDAQYPPDAKWSSDAYIRLTSWRQGSIGLELLGAVGEPNPWSDTVRKQKGHAIQHIAIGVGNTMDETIADLRSKGGAWTNGKRGGSYAYLDFSDTLGLTFELNGSSKSAAGAQ